MTASTDTIQVQVALGNRSYPIYIGSSLDDLLAGAIQKLRSASRPLALITDANVLATQSPFIQTHFAGVPTYSLEAGEQSKNLTNFSEALEFLAKESMDRSAVIVALGGGVVGDFAGYVAASYMRGIDFIQIPTTLLAMVDSSVGGKTGVNLKAGKNLVGAFHQPKSVWIDLNRLVTLDETQFSAGMAEIIKAGLLADMELFERLEALPRLDASSQELPGIIESACRIKAQVVAADETEAAKRGGRALLNLGHTFGHAIEQCTQYSTYLHGEAIAIGMHMAAQLSRILGYIDEGEVERINNCLVKYELPVKLDHALTVENMLTAMGRDKKKSQGTLRYVVLEKLGSAKTQSDIKPEQIIRAMNAGGVI
jgi:3-dehydroquinate synthase